MGDQTVSAEEQGLQLAQLIFDRFQRCRDAARFGFALCQGTELGDVDAGNGRLVLSMNSQSVRLPSASMSRRTVRASLDSPSLNRQAFVRAGVRRDCHSSPMQMASARSRSQRSRLFPWPNRSATDGACIHRRLPPSLASTWTAGSSRSVANCSARTAVQ